MVNTILVPTLGTVLIGDLISCVLYGLTSMQTYNYYDKFWDKDKWGLKLVVLWLWLLETVHTLMISVFIWRALVLEFDDPVGRLTTRPSDDVTTSITGLIIFTVHCFYTHRLWIVSRGNWLLIGIVSILTVCHFCFEITTMVLTFIFPSFADFHKITPYYTTSMALAAAADIIIAVSMCYLLMYRHTEVKSTNRIVSKTIVMVISTGVLTSVTDLVVLICFVAMPNNLVYLAFFNFITNFYSNSFLASLNARESHRDASATAINTQSYAPSDFCMTVTGAAESGAQKASHVSSSPTRVGPRTTSMGSDKYTDPSTEDV